MWVQKVLGSSLIVLVAGQRIEPWTYTLLLSANPVVKLSAASTIGIKPWLCFVPFSIVALIKK